MRDEKLIIKCPYCGAEYVPSEIFYPEEFVPEVDDLVKDDNGKIIAYTGNTMTLEEEYICDNCNHTFKAVAEVKLKSVECEKHDFDHDFESKIFDKERTELKED